MSVRAHVLEISRERGSVVCRVELAIGGQNVVVAKRANFSHLRDARGRIDRDALRRAVAQFADRQVRAIARLDPGATFEVRERPRPRRTR